MRARKGKENEIEKRSPSRLPAFNGIPSVSGIPFAPFSSILE